MLQTERLQFKPYLPEYRLALEKLCCENELVMKSTLKGRTFTRVEFESLINEEFIRTTKDAFGFCVLRIKQTDLLWVFQAFILVIIKEIMHTNLGLFSIRTIGVRAWLPKLETSG